MMARPGAARPLIAIDARYVRERPSGIGAMVKALVDLVPPRMPEVDFLLLAHPLAPRPLSACGNVREVRVAAEANGPVTLWGLPWAVDLRGVRLFHAPFNILPAGLSMPAVTTVHDVMWLTAPSLCQRKPLLRAVEWAFYRDGIRRALRRSARIIAISEATRREIASLDAEAGRRAVVIRHGLDPDFHPATSPEDLDLAREAQRRYAPGSERYVLTVGQATPYKNHPRVVQAFARAFRGDPGTHLVLVQRLGGEARALLASARSLGVERQVHVQSTVPFRHLLALYHGALALCHPSLMEGWGMPVSEALGAGCPVVTSDRSSMPEVCGEAGLLVDPEDPASIADALLRLRGDEALRQRLRQQGLDHARRWRWEDAADRTAQLYRELLEEAP